MPQLKAAYQVTARPNSRPACTAAIAPGQACRTALAASRSAAVLPRPPSQQDHTPAGVAVTGTAPTAGTERLMILLP